MHFEKNLQNYCWNWTIKMIQIIIYAFMEFMETKTKNDVHVINKPTDLKELVSFV